MFKFIEFLKKRPSDATIRTIRVLISLGLAGLLIYTKGAFILPFQQHYEEYAIWVVYGIAALFVIHAIIFGAFGLCVFKRSVMKKIQMIVGVVMILIGSSISYELSPSIGSPLSDDGSIDLSRLEVSVPSPTPVGGWLVFYGFFTFLVGATGKFVTSSCLKYGEVITKIRI